MRAAGLSVGSVQGRVTVEGGTLSPAGAKVSVEGQSVEVAADGTYGLYNLPPRKYDVTVEWNEVGTQIKTDVDVSANDPVMLDFVFQPPRPVLTNIFPPTVTEPRTLTLSGRHFLHAAQAALEVRINDKVVPATRKSDGEIEIASAVVSSIFQNLGLKKTFFELPVMVKVDGVASAQSFLAFQNTLPGNIRCEISLSNPRLPLTGARLKIPLRSMELAVPENRLFEMTKVPPRLYTIELDWPALGLRQEEKVDVLPGQTAPLKFKIEIPKPIVKTVLPQKIEKAEPIVLKGNYFMHSLAAKMEINVGEITVPAVRISNQVIQIPEKSVEKILKTYPDRPDLTGTVTIAGFTSEPFPLPVPTIKRDTAAEEEKGEKKDEEKAEAPPEAPKKP